MGRTRVILPGGGRGSRTPYRSTSPKLWLFQTECCQTCRPRRGCYDSRGDTENEEPGCIGPAREVSRCLVNRRCFRLRLVERSVPTTRQPSYPSTHRAHCPHWIHLQHAFRWQPGISAYRIEALPCWNAADFLSIIVGTLPSIAS